MHSIKLENFAREYPGREFPWFRTLGASEAGELLARLAARLGTDVNPVALDGALYPSLSTQNTNCWPSATNVRDLVDVPYQGSN